MGTVMILVASLTVWYAQVVRYGHRFQVITGKGYRPALVKLGKWVWLAWALLVVFWWFARRDRSAWHEKVTYSTP